MICSYEGERDAASINELLGDVAGEVGTVDAMQPHAKTFRSSSQKQSVKSTAEQTISTLDGRSYAFLIVFFSSRVGNEREKWKLIDCSVFFLFW